MTRGDEDLVLDLFSGTGSATQPFVECGKHRVVRIDIAGSPDIRADVRNLPIRPDIRPRFVWASPPCTEFSTLTNLRKYWPGKTGPIPENGMPLVRAAFSAARSADYWVVENVAGSIPHIGKEFGRPRFIWAGRVCWSNVELPLMSPPSRWWRKFGRRPSKKEPEKLAEFKEMMRRRGVQGDSFKDHSRARSMIPRPLAQAVHDAVCQ
jgi:hypothetical protein